MICHNVQKTCLWLHRGKVPPSNTKLTLANGNSTAEKGILIYEPGITNSIEFIVSLYKAGLEKSAINTARSALSSVLAVKDRIKFGEHPQEVRCMKGIFELDGCHSATFKKWTGYGLYVIN